MTPAKTRSRSGAMASVARRPVTVAAMSWIVAVVACVSLADALFPGGPLAQELTNAYAPPSPQHLLGTDALGRDLLARVLFGGRVTLSGALIGTVVTILAGVPLGLMAGYFRGWVDRAAGFVADLFMSVPLLLMILLASAIFPNNNLVSMTLFGLITSAAMFRIVRGATLTVASELYVTAAQASGLSHAAVIARHVAPRLRGLLFVQTSIVVAIALVIQIGLGFLGLDVAPPDPSWGSMIADASRGLFVSIWPIVPPTLFVVLTILAFGVIGDLAQDQASGRSSSIPIVRRGRGRTAPFTPGARTGTAQSSLLSVEGLTVSVTGDDGVDQFLVQDVSFDIAPGEILGLVGESGAGKSVTARAILGINGNVSTTGTAYFGGRDLLAMSPSELRKVRGSGIAFVGQDPMSSLDPLFTVESQLSEAIRIHRSLSRREVSGAVRELLRSVRIPDPDAVARRYPFELSGGMAQRVCIALALAGDPQLLIADEPTTALDVTVQMEVLGLLRRLRDDRGLAIILVTHDWGVVADMCDRSMTMYAGEVVESAAVDQIFGHPLHPYTLALRAADPHLLSVGDRLTSVPGTLPAPGAWPAGCRFADRCGLAIDTCREIHPPLQVVADEHSSRCLRVDVLQSNPDQGGRA